jgi:MerR family transcriptional regulator, copper efflux regulator
VTLLHISELAERSQVPSSTLRYYERIGLVEPVGRAANGYRQYDQTSLERLSFIRRAKRLGMRLVDVVTLVDAWFDGNCEPAQDQLRVFVTGRIAELRQRIADDSAFERQLERILVRIGEGRAAPERCDPDCGCDTLWFEESGPVASVCSLGRDGVERRLQQWRRLLREARAVEGHGGTLRAEFDPSAVGIADLARLCAAETVCCPFFTFNLEITASAVVVMVDGPEGLEERSGGFCDVIRKQGSSVADAEADRLASGARPGTAETAHPRPRHFATTTSRLANRF